MITGGAAKGGLVMEVSSMMKSRATLGERVADTIVGGDGSLGGVCPCKLSPCPPSTASTVGAKGSVAGRAGGDGAHSCIDAGGTDINGLIVFVSILTAGEHE